MYSVTILIVAFFVCAVQASVSEPAWTGVKELIPAQGSSIFLSYLLDQTHLTIKLSAETEGWIGFGLAELTTGSMGGADIVTVYVANDEAVVEDRHVDWTPYKLGETPNFFPSLDANPSDWEVLSWSEVSGTTSVTLRRLIDTGDLDDRAVLNGTNRIIYALGDADGVSYHGAKRGSGTIDFTTSTSSTSIAPDDSPNNLTLTIGGFSIPTKRTTYACKYWDISNEISGFDNRHITAVDIVLDPATAKYVHHALVHICPTTLSQWNTAAECQSPTGTACDTLIYAWAVGGNPIILPKEAGFLTGFANGDVRHIVFEIHYDNPNGDGSQVDDSGFIMYFTDQGVLRNNDASTVVLGDPIVTFSSIDSGEDIYHLEGVCPGTCTERLFSGQTITVFGSFLHMHSFGRQIYTSKSSNSEVNRADFWNFEFQQITDVSYTLSSGESIHTHCTFDSSLSSSQIDFGTASDEEMCMDFLFYYPRIPDFALCGAGRFVGTLTGAEIASLIGIACSGTVNLGFGDIGYDFCGNTYNIDTDATICGELDVDGIIFVPPGYTPPLIELFTGGFSQEMIQSIINDLTLKQSDFYDGRGFLETSFGKAVAAPVSPTASPANQPAPTPGTVAEALADNILYISIGAIGIATAALVGFAAVAAQKKGVKGTEPEVQPPSHYTDGLEPKL